MKLFCISDLHGKLAGLDPTGCDLVIIAGDFAKMTGWGKWHIYDMKKWIENKFQGLEIRSTIKAILEYEREHDLNQYSFDLKLIFNSL